MAQDKKSFVLYSDSQGLVNQLPDDIAGRLLKHIYAYVNDENPISDELLLNIAFEPIKMQLKRDLLKWEDIKESKSINGKMGNLKRYNIDLYNDVLANKITLEQAENLAKSRKVSQGDSGLSLPIAKLAVNDNVNVNVNVNDINNNISLSLENDFLKFWNIYNKKNDSKRCKDKFIKLPKKDIDKILEVVNDYVVLTPDVKFRKNPLTWLNGKCWNDIEKTEYSPTPDKPFGKTNQI